VRWEHWAVIGLAAVVVVCFLVVVSELLRKR
jgi:hypothetical protein